VLGYTNKLRRKSIANPRSHVRWCSWLWKSECDKTGTECQPNERRFARLSTEHWTLRIGIRLKLSSYNLFYRAMHFSAKRGIAIACRLSVRLW